MARVRLIDERDVPELDELVGRIKGARGGRLINIYRLMLHSPPLARAWFELNQAVRYGTDIDGQCRELAVIRVAILNKVPYVVRAHGATYALREGLSEAQVEGLANWRAAANLYDSRQRALLAYVDAMTTAVRVSEQVFADLGAHFSERQIVELTMLIGAYNMLTRVLQALEVDPEPDA